MQSLILTVTFIVLIVATEILLLSIYSKYSPEKIINLKLKIKKNKKSFFLILLLFIILSMLISLILSLLSLSIVITQVIVAILCGILLSLIA